LAGGMGWLLMGTIVLPAWTQSTNAPTPLTLEGIGQAMGAVQTVFTRFVQTRHLSLFKDPLRSEGVLCCEKPGRIRWEITAPYQSILVSDGTGVAQFEWMDERWKKLDVGLADALQRVVSQIAGVIEGRYATSGKEFRASLSVDAGEPVITLVPQSERVRKMMAAIEVHLAPDLRGTRRVVLRENNEDFTDIRFEDQATNVKLPPRTFDRSQPAPLERIQEGVRKGRR
jgi:outer membrane lipoprotein-sorting protein